MIAQCTDSVAGTALYVNPTYVVTLRPEPEDPSRVTILKLSDGETIEVHGDHAAVAAKFAKPR